jgi:polysaccharide export outer membrane protein
VGLSVVLLRNGQKVVRFASTTFRICLVMCALFPGGILSAQEPRTPAPSPTRDAVEYRIGPQDVIQIDVWKEPEITRTIPVRPDGKISLPLLNDVQAAGLTAMHLAGVIRKGLMTYLTNPQVTVTVRRFGAKPLIVPPSKSAPRSLPSPDIKPKCCVA